MSPAFSHQAVMVDEVVSLLAPIPAGLVVDATVGGAGHAVAVLEAHSHLKVLGMDRDPVAVAAAKERLAPFGARARIVHGTFDTMADHLRTGEMVSGVLFDFGVSSVQLDTPERGFSYRLSGALDMRMDPGTDLTAAQLVNTMDAGELARLFAEHGESRFARRIALAVVSSRPIETTSALAEVVRDAIPAPARRTGGHPARRVFQALRVAVNDELTLVEAGIAAAIDLLVPGGRCLALAYHSGEDRLVKTAFATAVSGGCVCPPRLPCTCGAEPLGRLVFRGARRPSPAEVSANRRAEAARLRAFERVAHDGGTR